MSPQLMQGLTVERGMHILTNHNCQSSNKCSLLLSNI